MEPYRPEQRAGDEFRPEPPAPEQQDRCARFLTRLDGHLAALVSDTARRTFIDRQLEAWQRRYGRFISTQGACAGSLDAAEPPQATDFLLTISALAARRKALGKADRPTSREVTGMPGAAWVSGADDHRRPANASAI
jgi:hypothetical protein